MNESAYIKECECPGGEPRNERCETLRENGGRRRDGAKEGKIGSPDLYNHFEMQSFATAIFGTASIVHQARIRSYHVRVAMDPPKLWRVRQSGTSVLLLAAEDDDGRGLLFTAAFANLSIGSNLA